MSVRIDSIYQGDLRVAGTHGPSGVTLNTDAPVDNHGKGESFSPTDLVATALAHCMLTIMGIKAQSLGIDIKGSTVSIEKIMSADLPRRIVALPMKISMKGSFTEEQKNSLIAAAGLCPVAKSIAPEIDKPIDWSWA